jgi:hypothetical protein
MHNRQSARSCARPTVLAVPSEVSKMSDNPENNFGKFETFHEVHEVVRTVEVRTGKDSLYRVEVLRNCLRPADKLPFSARCSLRGVVLRGLEPWAVEPAVTGQEYPDADSALQGALRELNARLAALAKSERGKEKRA